MNKDNVKRILELINLTIHEVKQVKKGYDDIEELEKLMGDPDGMYITFNAGGWTGGEFCPDDLHDSDFNDITKAAIEVIHKRLGVRKGEALKHMKELSEILQEVEQETNEQ